MEVLLGQHLSQILRKAELGPLALFLFWVDTCAAFPQACSPL